MKKTYNGFSVEKCLENASDDLGVSKEKIKYTILEEKKSLFRKKVIIEVCIPDEFIEKKGNGSQKGVGINKEKLLSIDKNQGTVKITDNKIIVKNPTKEGSQAAYILIEDNIKLVVDGEVANGRVEVYEKNNLEVYFQETKASRELKISISKDNMEVYANVIYTPQTVYKLIDKEEGNSVTLQAQIVSQINPPKYNIEDVKQELVKNNVFYGIIEENLKKCVENSCESVLIAKGQDVIDGKDDTIELKFQIDKDINKLREDSGGNIDFKSIGAVEDIHKGDVIAIRHEGKEGQDGHYVTSKIKKHKPAKRIKLKVGSGCVIQDGDMVIADIDGKPCVKNNTFYVYPVHEVSGDVDLKTGNIKFIGDVVVHGSVREGMEIICGNSLSIHGDIEMAKIRARGDIDIKGNVIASEVCSGGEDVKKLKMLKNLEQLKDTLYNLINNVQEIKKYNLLGENMKDGEVLKVLIENKFRDLPMLCISIIKDLRIQKDELNEKQLDSLIRDKLLGIGPISVKNYGELDLIISEAEEEIKNLKATLSLPVNLKISYCQDSELQSSGDLLISGKGEYISNITANGSIYFIQEKGVARGGLLKAKNEIKARIVGSSAGVSTKLEVDKLGHIWVDMAYQNTTFVVGQREYSLDVPSKSIHAYLDDVGDIAIEKFKI
jgi:uncharacterized protein (DUF342 family)